ncbi:response regulator transcription factor [uncultured Pseudoflavonifractor sp.]|uniref:response regulator transcription factor n=1 Tax=uncultured Pseudoflavonifractor sp. TaxID=1221379 RepID=UPI0025EC0C99|nr:response regulator transcription factor [uncultured Pseudoflavonifractor sp.]
MAARILIVDDEEKLRAAVAKHARHAGYEIAECADGHAAVARCREGGVDLVILDIMLPGLDGYEVLRAIRTFSDIPVIMLSVHGEEQDKVRGFKLGVDDFMVKPFSHRELMCRVAAILRRRPAQALSPTLGAGGLVVDPAARRVSVDGRPVGLSPKEFDLLLQLVSHPGAAMPRQLLLETVWGADRPRGERTLDTHIKQVRRAIGPYAGCIVTLRGVGYRFDAVPSQFL